MQRILILIFIILILALAIASCAESSDKIEYTYPEFTIEIEDSDSESLAQGEDNIVSESGSDISESISESDAEDTTDAPVVDNKNPDTEAVESQSSIIEEEETETKSIHVDDRDENGYCDICGVKIEDNSSSNSSGNVSSGSTVALFNQFYDSGFDTTKSDHSDGGAMTEKSDTYTNNGYELKFLNYSNLYKNARDAKGNPALKLGKKSAIGSFEICVPDSVNRVVLKIAKYKDQASAVIVNGVEYTLTKNSNDGQYDEIIVDTSKSKTIVVSSSEIYKVCMIRSIEFIK